MLPLLLLLHRCAAQFYAYNGAHSLFGMPCLQVGAHVGGGCGKCVQAPQVAGRGPGSVHSVLRLQPANAA